MSTDSKSSTIALLSGNGAAALLAAATPWQLWGRVPIHILPWAFLIGAAFFVVFGLATVQFLIKLIHLEDPGSAHDGEIEGLDERGSQLSLGACVAIVLLMLITGVALWFAPSIFEAPLTPAESAAPIAAPASDPSPPTPEDPPGSD